MLKKIIALVFVFSLLAMPTAIASKISSDPLRRVIIEYTSDPRPLLKILNQQGFDVAGINIPRHEIEVITTEKGVEWIKSKGITSRIVAKQGIDAQNVRKVDPRYLNPQKVEAKLKALNQAYPSLTRLEQIGTSFQGLPIWALLISTTPSKRNLKSLEKPTVIFDGMHHAREVMTSEIVMDIAETTLIAFQQRRSGATRILNNWNIWIVPMLNVDGNNIVWTSNAWWRKNAHTTDGKIHGVDLNRNYSYRWGECDGSSGSKSSDTFRGDTAASEPETQALMRLANLVRPTASISYHSYSELVLYPFGCDGELTGENALLARIGNELAKRLPRDSGSGHYTPGTPWQLLYSVDGDSMDYIFGTFGALTYTIEVNQEFQPPYSLRSPTLVKERLGWGYFMSEIDKRLMTLKVIDGKTGLASEAEVAVSTISHAKKELPFKTNRIGMFFKVLDPGKYIVGAKLANGRTQEITVQMSDTPQTVTLVVP